MIGGSDAATLFAAIQPWQGRVPASCRVASASDSRIIFM
jgi:hypothetical protein